ncbi:MAG TPA: hypothetical protein VE010_15850, partial [Thermoanaerobaculia bacterium]|nr:hypothetical protein [Thermoanaerobaculia bacterium]
RDFRLFREVVDELRFRHWACCHGWISSPSGVFVRWRTSRRNVSTNVARCNAFFAIFGQKTVLFGNSAR